MIIHFNLVNKVCKKLRIQSISLTKEKLIRNYDEKIFKKTITHKILLNLIIESHKKLTVSMLIADINHHEVILSKLWMNKNEILLNMQNNIIVFLNQFKLIIKSSFNINLLTQLKYLISIFWLDSNTWFQHSDSVWYRSQVDTRFKFSIQLIKKSNMTSRELNIEIFPIFRLCIIFLIESHKEKHEEKHEDHLIKSFDRRLW